MIDSDIKNALFSREEIESVHSLQPTDKSERLAYTEDTTEEVHISSEEVHKAAKDSLDFLAALCMPTVFKYFYPPVLLAAWNWLTAHAHKVRDFSQLALGIPRGFGKSTMIKIFIIYCILFTNKRFILVLAATSTLAENIISDVVDILDEPNIRSVFGDWRIGIEKDTQPVKKFAYRGRNIILAALGSGASLRGLNLKNERPDVMIFDDVQTRECADSETESSKLFTWMIGTAMKAKSPIGCLYVFIGNMYPTKLSILRKLKKNAKWVKFIVGGILADGTSLWPDLQPIEQLLSEFESDLAMGHPEIFAAEVLNDENAQANNIIDLSKLPEYPFSEEEIRAGSFIIIDPSNDKKKSDNTAIGFFEIFATKPVLQELISDVLNPGQLIYKALEIAVRTGCSVIFVESNAYQYSLLYWFEQICQQLQITGIHFIPIYSGVISKQSRIIKMLRSYAAGDIFLNPKVTAEVHEEILGFNPLLTNNTDNILDLLTYIPVVLTDHQEYILDQSIIRTQEHAGTKVLDVLQTSCF